MSEWEDRRGDKHSPSPLKQRRGHRAGAGARPAMRQRHAWPGGQRVCPRQPLRKGTTRHREGEIRPDFTKSNDVALCVTGGTRAPRLFQEAPAGPGFPSRGTCPMMGKLAAWDSILGPTQLCRSLGTGPPACPLAGLALLRARVGTPESSGRISMSPLYLV